MWQQQRNVVNKQKGNRNKGSHTAQKEKTCKHNMDDEKGQTDQDKWKKGKYREKDGKL